ncbi:MAG: TonB-dependent receptor [Cellvibrio sp.]|uniref:TonB-dependent receptor plug domain-containing protein n=1 Tax=Cellvibrio sp. TaxID=1965322 RepID=UPI0031B52AE0
MMQGCSKTACVLLTGFLLGSFCVNATAADFLEMDLEQLLQVSITGSTLRDEALKTVPSAVTVFTHEQIAVLGVDYLYELLNLVPAYQVSRVGDNAVNYTYSARGRRNSSQAREILVLVDGRLFSNPRTGSSDAVIPFFPVAQIERVEVIRGPGSALYGSSAFTGVINIITRKRAKEVKLTLGSDQRRSVDLLWGQESGYWETSLYAHAQKDAGQDYGLHDLYSTQLTPSGDAAQSTNLDVGIRYQRTQLRITDNHSDSDDFYSLERVRNDFNNNGQGFTQLSVEQGFNVLPEVKSTLTFAYSHGYQRIHTEVADYRLLQAQSQPPSDEPFLVRAQVKGETYRLALANDWTISDHASSQFGIEVREDEEIYAKVYTNYDLAQYVARDFPIRYYGDDLQRVAIGREEAQKSMGVYGQYLHQLETGTNLTFGLRYDDYQGIADHLSPRLGIVQQLTENHTLKLLYGEAFRAPTLSETGLINNTRVVGNPDLKHELVKTWDLIWMGNWQRSSFSINGFYSRYDQPIIAGLLGSTRTYINSDGEENSGISLEASRQLSDAWIARITYTQYTKLPDSALRESDEKSTLMLNYKQQQWNWNITAIYQNERETLAPGTTRNTLESVWLVNSKLGYQLSPEWGISLQAKNLFDETYFTPTQGNTIAAGIPNRGRELSLGVDWRW